MARPLIQHLDDEEIEFLVSHAPESGHVGNAERLLQGSFHGEAALHAQSCQQCELRLRMHRDMQDVLRDLQATGRTRAASKCPERAKWDEVVGGVLSKGEALSLLRHAADCQRCNTLLKQSIELFSDEATPEEEAILSALPSGRAAWQTNTAVRLHEAAGPRIPRRRMRWWPPTPLMLLLVTASFSILVVAASITYRSLRNPSPEALIARAYFENRTIDLRFSGAAHSPLRERRGSRPSNVGQPLPLLEAEVLVARNLARRPDDLNYIDAKIRTDVLDGNFDAAIRSVAPPETVQPASIALATDLATAYFMHGEASGDKEDLAEANELLDSVLQVSPNDTIALFNSAIVKEKLDLSSLARDTWDRYLKVETDSAWRQEGQSRSDALRQTMDGRSSSAVLPLNDSAAALPRLLARAGTDEWPLSVDESYIQIALTQWLQVVPESAAAKDGWQEASAWRSLEALGKVLHARHQDEWLNDLISGRHSRSWERGVHELSLAASANSVGDIRAQMRHANRSLAEFYLDGNIAGETAARLEYVIGLTRSQLGDRCLPATKAGLREIHSARYPWVEASLLFQLSTCYGIRGDPYMAENSARFAAVVAKRSSYENLRLVSLYYLDGVSAPWVASGASWGRIVAGLNEFWATQHFPEFGAIFYLDMAMGAESEAKWHVAEDAAREAVFLFAKADDRVDEAAAHHYLAQAAEAADDPEVAEGEYQRAGQLFSELSQQDPAARATLEIERASLEVRQNRIAAASARLNKLNKILPGIHNAYAELAYYEALGELHLRSSQSGLAEQDLEKAISLVESSELSFVSDEDRLVWHRYNSSAYRILLEIYSRVMHEDTRSFEFQEWYRGTPLRAYNRDRHLEEPRPLDGSERMSGRLSAYSTERLQIPRGTAILSWMAFPSGLAVWLADDHGPLLEWENVTSRELETTIARFSARCADPASDPRLIDRDARQLYSRLVRPFQSRLEGSTTLIVESDPSMPSVPFPALETADGKYLGEQFRIIESPGVDYSRNLHRGTGLSAASVLLSIGNPVPNAEMSADFPPLPDAETEAAAIAANFQHHILLTGAGASLTRVVELLPQTEILHYAGHAVLNQREPGLLLAGMLRTEPALLMADKLRAVDIKKLKLAVLSACGTANTDQGLAGPGNLVRAFLSAGVPHVVASKWRVDSQVTSELMTDFYSGLVSGKSVPEALRIAEARVRSHPETAHPYYWAAFASFGS